MLSPVVDVVVVVMEILPLAMAVFEVGSMLCCCSLMELLGICFEVSAVCT